MQVERKSLEQVRDEYRRRHVRHLAILALWAVYLATTLWGSVIPKDQRVLFLFGGVIVFGGVAMANWRCPQCGHFFGRTLWETRCSACGIEFREGAPPGAAA